MKTISFALILLAAFPARSDTIVAPSAQANGSEYLPFYDTAPTRYQQVFDASQFLNSMPNGGTITQISFSRDFYPSCFFGVASNLTISFSTTAASSASLSPVFAANEGADQALVFSGQHVFGSLIGSGYAEHFTVSPFTYDPRVGNLLMEVKNLSGTGDLCGPFRPPSDPVPGLDAVFGQGLGVNSLAAFSADATTGFSFSTQWGLLTQFTFTPVPEPSPLWLGATAFGLIAVFRLFRREPVQKRDRSQTLKLTPLRICLRLIQYSCINNQHRERNRSVAEKSLRPSSLT